MTTEDAAKDLAFVRTLAEEGRTAPLLGGAHLVAFGALTAGAYLGHYAILTYADPIWLLANWMGFGVLAGVVGGALDARMRAKPGFTAVTNRVDTAVWGGVGAAGFAIAVAALARLVLEDDVGAPNVIPGAAFALYAAAMLTTATLSGDKIMRVSGWLAVAAAIVALVVQAQPWMYLFAAAGAVVVLLLPGLALMRREPSEVV